MEFSLIIPALNAEKHVENCLFDLEKQTFKDFEAIFINDGSIDCTKIIANSIKTTYPLKIINHASNQGLSSSRNDGLREASGEWIIFLDVDDFIDHDCLRSLHEIIEKNEFDVALFPYNEKWVKNRKEYCRKALLKDGVFGRNQLISNLLLEIPYPVLSCVGSKVYNTKFLNTNHLFFDDLLYKYNEDGAFILNALSAAKQIGYFDYPYYQYMKYGEGTIMTSYRPNMLKTMLNVELLLRNLILINNNPRQKQIVECYEKDVNLFIAALKNEYDYSKYSSFVGVSDEIRKTNIFQDVFNHCSNQKKKLILILIKYRMHRLLYFCFRLIYGGNKHERY